MRSTIFSVLLTVALCAIATGAVVAQPLPRVINLWVDPIHGDDAGAASWNPPGPSLLACGPNENNPHDVIQRDANDNQVGEVLLHAPWPFKTIDAAVAWIRSQLGSPPLPNQSSITTRQWTYAVIHLLPGVYARYTDQHKDNGILGNGDTFPIRLPNNVSIQGTSALNTLIDLHDPTVNPPAGWGVGPAFEFGGVVGEEPIEGINCFIDSVSIMGAEHDSNTLPNNPIGMAILIKEQHASRPTISNCFLFNNSIGIMLAGNREEPAVRHHGTVIVNNTIAFNRIGIWNGQWPPGTPTPIPTQGVSELIVFNNIMDPGMVFGLSLPHCPNTFPKSWKGIGGASAFEGMAAEDMTINGVDYNAYPSVVGDPPTPGPGRNTENASGTVILGRYPRADRRSGSTNPVPATSRDISGIVGSASRPRGILYVRDLLCNGGANFVVSTAWQGSHHDFRLAPACIDAAGGASEPPAPPGQNGYLNRLVDNGFASSGQITMGNGRSLTAPPGSLDLGAEQNTWPFSSWDEDCEGYGNPRIHDHPIYDDAGVGAVDVGADEMGELIIAGYLFGTTWFVKEALINAEQHYQWYLGPPSSINGTSGVPWSIPPFHRRIDHLNPPPTNYQVQIQSLAYSLAWWSDWTWPVAGGSTYYQPTLADITPHLVPDPHPWWHAALTAFPANPIWQWCSAPQTNQALFIHPMAGVANPPGAYRPPHGSSSYLWLDESGTSKTFDIFGAGYPPLPSRPYGGPQSFTNVDDWCRLFETSGEPPVTYVRNTFLDSAWTNGAAGGHAMLRFSVETLFSTWGNATSTRNLQSFGIYVND